MRFSTQLPIHPRSRPKRVLSRVVAARPDRDSPPVPPENQPKISRILVPIDFTREANLPLEYADLLSTALRAVIDVIHVTPPLTRCVDCGYGPTNRSGPDNVQMTRDDAHLHRFAQKHLPSGRLGSVIIRTGIVSDEILGAAKDLEADLIILVPHARDASESFKPHPTIERVTRLASCPVLVLPSREKQ